MEKTIKTDNQIMSLLKLNTINRLICQTDKGMLTLQIRKEENNYHLLLDSVPLNEDENNELMSMLFPKKQEVPQVTTSPIINSTVIKISKPKGRPKNK